MRHALTSPKDTHGQKYFRLINRAWDMSQAMRLEICCIHSDVTYDHKSWAVNVDFMARIPFEVENYDNEGSKKNLTEMLQTFLFCARYNL